MAGTERDHPKRGPMRDELHARSAPRINEPALVLHLALKHPQAAALRDPADDIRQLVALAGAAEDELPGDARHHTFTRDGWEVTWETHSEFTAYTALRPLGPELPGGQPFDTDARGAFPTQWEDADTAGRIAAVAVAVLPMPPSPEQPKQIVNDVSPWLDPTSTLITRVRGGECVLAGDFKPDAAGYTRFVLFVPDQLGPGRIGRTVQQIIELETYRSLAMIGFIRSHELSERLAEIDPQLMHLISQLDEPEPSGETLLHELLSVTAELETLAMAHDFRFGATTAYAAIVENRLATLNETPFLGRQTIREFLARRYVPAIRTVDSREDRLRRMLERSGRAADLLRTKVDVQRAAQNQELLHSMDARAETQLRLQHTVEGLSIVAISYYALGLIAYVLAPFLDEWDVSKVWLMAALTPAVLLVAWLGTRWVTGRIHRDLERT